MHATIWTAPRVADGATATTLAGYGGNARREWSAQDAEATALSLTGDGWTMSGYSLRDHLVSAAAYAVNGDRTAHDAAVPCVFCGQTTAPDAAGDWIGCPNAGGRRADLCIDCCGCCTLVEEVAR